MDEEKIIATLPPVAPPADERVVSALPAKPPEKKKSASIIIPCCGQIEYTKLCVPSVLKHTRQPFELIFIDIGSLDGTAEYLAGLAAGSSIRIEVVHTPTDLGIAEAVHDALSLARGDYVVLLNNDTIVTYGWVNMLAGLVEMSPVLGMVGPMSNYAAPPQFVEKVPYRVGPKKASRRGERSARVDQLVDVHAVDAFAKTRREGNVGGWTECERLGGFCLLIKRDILKRIGHLRDANDLDLFDTDILSSKVRQAGYKLACCRDLFVHHFGTRTFAHGAPRAEAEKATV